MIPHPLRPRVILLSWATAFAAWPLAWSLLAVGQGLGVLASGGGWIGVAVPLGQHPWALVNEPTVAFAATRAALFGYWLAPVLVALLLSVALPITASTPRSWAAELAVCQVGYALAALGLGWAPVLGVDDGPAAGLARFWKIDGATVVIGAALAGMLAVQPAALRLNAHLWQQSGGPRRARRIAVVALHFALPSLGWMLASVLVGWLAPGRAFLALAAVTLAALVGAWIWTPRSPLRPRPEVTVRALLTAALVGVIVAGCAAWAGAPSRGGAKALLWGAERMTSNVRSTMVRIHLLGAPEPATKPAN